MIRAEVWDRANQARLSVLSQVVSAARRRAIGREETLDLEVVHTDPGLNSLTRSAVIRLQRSGHADDFSLWRLVRDSAELRQDGSRVRRLAMHALWMDLRHGRVRQAQVDGTVLFSFGLIGLTPQQWIEDVILPGYDGDAIAFQVGTVELIDPVDLTFDGSSPLDALRMLEQASAGELQWRYSADGQTCFVDLLTRLGSATGGARLRYGKNILGLDRLEDDSEAISRLYAQGSGILTLADAEWPITSVGGGAGARVIGFLKSPVFEDGAFVGLYLVIPGRGAYPIDASEVTTGTVTVDEGADPIPQVGDRAYLATTAAGPRLSYLESPSAAAAIGVRTGQLIADDIPDAINLLANGDFALWSGGAPSGWTALGTPTLTPIVDPLYGRSGGSAARVQAAAEGEGLISDAVSVPTGNSRRPYAGMMAALTVASGSVRMELRHSNGMTYPVKERPGPSGVGVYLTLSATAHDEPLPAGTVRLAVIAHAGPADFYLDAAMVTPQLAAEVPAFVRDQGAWILWDRAVHDLQLRSVEVREYRVAVADLFSIDSTRFPFDELRLGDDVQVWDPEFGAHTLRLVEISDDPLRPEATQIAVAPGPWQRPVIQDLDAFRPLYQPKRPGAGSSPINPERPADPVYSLQNLRFADETAGRRYYWDNGAGIQEIWTATDVVTGDVTEADWLALESAVALQGLIDEFLVPWPGEGQRTIGRIEGRWTTAAGDSGPETTYVLKIDVPGTRPPISVEATVTENTAGTQATITATVTDPRGVVGAANIYILQNGVETGPTAMGAAGDVYTHTVNLLPKPHITSARGELVRNDGGDPIPFAVPPIDSDKSSNVIDALPVPGDPGEMDVQVQFDSDTVTGAGEAEYRLDGGSAVAIDVDANGRSTVTVTQSTSATILFEVRGYNAAGVPGDWFPVTIAKYVQTPAFFPRITTARVTIVQQPLTCPDASTDPMTNRVHVTIEDQQAGYTLKVSRYENGEAAAVVASGLALTTTQVDDVITGYISDLGGSFTNASYFLEIITGGTAVHTAWTQVIPQPRTACP